MSRYRKFTTICCAAALAFGLAACGSSSDDDTADSTPPVVTPDPEPDPIDAERKAISDAIAAAQVAAQMVTDAATDDQVAAADIAVAAAMNAIDDATLISAGEAATSKASLATIQGQLAAAKSSRTMTMNLATQRGTISSAIAAATTAVDAVADDSTAEEVEAAENAIAAANAAIAEAGGILASEAAAKRAKVAALQTSLDNAKSSRQMAMDAADEEERQRLAMEARRTEQLAAINMAIEAARTAVGMVNDESTQQQVDNANAAVANAKAKIDEAADVSDDMKATHTASVDTLATSLTNAGNSWQMAQDANQEIANQRMAISNAIGAARTAVAAVGDESTDEQVEAATQAIADARVAIAGAADVPAEEKVANTETVGEIRAQLETAKTSRTAAIDAVDEEQRMADAAMVARAAKLYDGIGATPLATAGATSRGAAHATGDDAGKLAVTIGTVAAVNLSEDKTATVAATMAGKARSTWPPGLASMARTKPSSTRMSAPRRRGRSSMHSTTSSMGQWMSIRPSQGSRRELPVRASASLPARKRSSCRLRTRPVRLKSPSLAVITGCPAPTVALLPVAAPAWLR